MMETLTSGWGQKGLMVQNHQPSFLVTWIGKVSKWTFLAISKFKLICYKISIGWLLFLFFSFLSGVTGDRIQDFVHAKHELYHYVITFPCFYSSLNCKERTEKEKEKEVEKKKKKNVNKELKPALVGLKNTPNLENAQVLSRERVILRVFPYIWRLGSRRMSGFRTRQSGGVSWMVTGRALSHLSFSALPPGPTTGMHAPASQAGSRVCESGCSSLWQANANAFFSLFVFNLHAVPVSTFMQYPSHTPFLSSDWVPEYLIGGKLCCGGSVVSCLKQMLLHQASTPVWAWTRHWVTLCIEPPHLSSGDPFKKYLWSTCCVPRRVPPSGGGGGRTINRTESYFAVRHTWAKYTL